MSVAFNRLIDAINGPSTGENAKLVKRLVKEFFEEAAQDHNATGREHSWMNPGDFGETITTLYKTDDLAQGLGYLATRHGPERFSIEQINMLIKTLLDRPVPMVVGAKRKFDT